MGHFHWNSKPLEGRSATGGKDLWAMDEMEGEGEASLCWRNRRRSFRLSEFWKPIEHYWRLTYPRYDFLTMGLSEIRDNLQLLLDTYYFEFRIYMVLMVLVKLIHVQLCLCGHLNHTWTTFLYFFYIYQDPAWFEDAAGEAPEDAPEAEEAEEEQGTPEVQGTTWGFGGFGGSLCKTIAKNTGYTVTRVFHFVCVCLCLSMCRWSMFVVFTCLHLLLPALMCLALPFLKVLIDALVTWQSDNHQSGKTLSASIWAIFTETRNLSKGAPPLAAKTSGPWMRWRARVRRVCVDGQKSPEKFPSVWVLKTDWTLLEIDISKVWLFDHGFIWDPRQSAIASGYLLLRISNLHGANGTCQTHSCSALSMRPPEPYLNHLSVLFLHIPGPRVVRRCSWRSSGRRPRSWRGWRGARNSRGPRHHLGIRGIRGIPMQNNCKEHRIHCDTCVSFCLCLFVFVDVSMIDVCRFHMFTLVAPSIDVPSIWGKVDTSVNAPSEGWCPDVWNTGQVSGKIVAGMNSKEAVNRDGQGPCESSDSYASAR